MKLTKDTNILIIGLGVIGGDYAAALTEAGSKSYPNFFENHASLGIGVT